MSKRLIITPKDMLRQWASAMFMFNYNLIDFEKRAGEAAVEVFQESFRIKSLPGTNIPWRPNKRNNPTLLETGTLRDSISTLTYNAGSFHTINVFTDERKFMTSARHRGFCYAAVHNDPSGTHYYGASGVPSIQRQFMGYSPVLKQKLIDMSAIIFRTFPGVGGI